MIASACSWVSSPARACARARAASKSSSACSQARPETCSATPPRARTPLNTSSDAEEDGLTLALYADIEPVAVLAGFDDDRCAPLLGHRVEHRIAAVVLVCEVDPGHATVEHATCEHVHVDMWGLPVAEPPGLDGEDLVRALRVGRAAAEAAEPRSELPVGVGLPGLDHAVGDRFARAVEQAAVDADATFCALRGDVRAVRPGQADRQVRADGLRGRGHGSIGVWRNTMSQRKASAQDSSVASWSYALIIRRAARSSRTELKIGSWKNSGSSGKYICVTSRCVNACPNRLKWMCAGRQAFGWLPHG